MSNILYNGAKLPALPQYDTQNYTYAVIVRLVDGDGIQSARASLYVAGRDSTVVFEDGVIYLSHTRKLTYASGTEWVGICSNQYDTPMLLALDKPGGVNEMGIATGAVTVWSNFDIYRQDGTLYLAASEPVPVVEKFDIKGWLTGFLKGLAEYPLGARKQEPVAYLYNGVRLPPLPEWDKQAYPYAAISYYATDALVSGSSVALLYISENPITAISSAQILKMGTYLNGRCMRYTWISDERLTELSYVNGLTDGWGYDWVQEFTDYKYPKTFTWANHDILYTNVEGVRLAGSEPVPVYA